jgi:Arc/MetJ-type ribon-helix-helix transcriptional regulator
MMAPSRYHDDMIRTQISLDERQMEGLRELARRRKVSMAELVREAVDALLEKPTPDQWERASAVIGKFRSGSPNIARDHDAYLDEIYGDW